MHCILIRSKAVSPVNMKGLFFSSARMSWLYFIRSANVEWTDEQVNVFDSFLSLTSYYHITHSFLAFQPSHFVRKFSAKTPTIYAVEDGLH